MKRMRIFINGEELSSWTGATLSRRKQDMTGELSVHIFMSYLPSEPVFTNAIQGSDIAVYIDNQLAFYGILDRRSGKSVKQRRDARGRFASGKVDGQAAGGELQRAIGSDGYQITLVARGQTKRLIDCSHVHDKGTMLATTDKQVIEELLKQYRIQVDWQAGEMPVEMNKIVFRDGAVVIDEVYRICNENSHFCYETRDGKLRVTDRASSARGEDLILGQNILTFDAEQSEDRANSEIRIKGHRNKKGIWGKDAIIDAEIRIKDNWVRRYSPVTIYHSGDATPEALRRRGKWEADKRASESKKITIEVFDLGPHDGEPWDIGNIHYVEIPPEGIATDFECVELTYRVDAGGTLNTRLTLAPAPAFLPQQEDNLLLSGNTPAIKEKRHAGRAITYPAAWGPAQITDTREMLAGTENAENSLIDVMPKHIGGVPLKIR